MEHNAETFMTMPIAGDFLFLKSVGENQQHSASQTAIVVWGTAC